MSDAFELEICQGKYRYRYEAGKQEAWRNGDTWPAMNEKLIGDKFVFSLAVELDEALKERDALRAETEELHALIAAVKKRADAEFRLRVKKEEEYARLQVKIEQMEQQKPVGKFIQHPSNGLWEQDGYGNSPDARPLYALPGAQNVPRQEE